MVEKGEQVNIAIHDLEEASVLKDLLENSLRIEVVMSNQYHLPSKDGAIDYNPASNAL
jgi:hypothetical protein